MPTVQIYNTRTDVWVQLPNQAASRALDGGNFFQYGSELIYYDKFGAIQFDVATNTWFTDWPDGVPVSTWKYQPGKIIIYQHDAS